MNYDLLFGSLALYTVFDEFRPLGRYSQLLKRLYTELASSGPTVPLIITTSLLNGNYKQHFI